MVKKRFSEIAKSYDAALHISDENISIGGGTRTPNLVMKMKFTYNNCDIIVENATGTSFSGVVKSKIVSPKITDVLELTTKNHFEMLFSFKKERFSIKTKNTALKSFLGACSSLKKLEILAKNDSFEPYITGNFRENSYFLIFKYSLQFDNWVEAIPTIVDFYKQFIDRYGRRAI